MMRTKPLIGTTMSYNLRNLTELKSPTLFWSSYEPLPTQFYVINIKVRYNIPDQVDNVRNYMGVDTASGVYIRSSSEHGRVNTDLPGEYSNKGMQGVWRHYIFYCIKLSCRALHSSFIWLLLGELS